MMEVGKRYAATNWLCRERKDYEREIRALAHTLCVFIYQHGMRHGITWRHGSVSHSKHGDPTFIGRFRVGLGYPGLPIFPNKMGGGLHDIFGIFSIFLSLSFSPSLTLTHTLTLRTRIRLLSPMRGLFGNSVKSHFPLEQ